MTNSMMETQNLNGNYLAEYKEYLMRRLDYAKCALESFERINNQKEVEYYRGIIAGLMIAIESAPEEE